MPSAAGVRAGKAYVELGVNSHKLVAGLKAASRKMKAFGAGVRNVGMQVAGVGVALAAPFAIATKVFMSMGDTIAKMSQTTGMAVEALSALEYVASQTGTSVETLQKGLMRMSRVINDARMGLKSAADALSLVGLTSAEIEGMSPEEVFKLMAERLSKIQDPMKKAAAAQMLFGRAGAEMIPMLNMGADGIDAMMEKAEELGLVMSAEDAKAAEQLTDAFDTLWRTMKSGLFRVGAAVAPTLEKIANKFIEVSVAVSEFINRNRPMVLLVFQVAVGLIAFGTVLMGLGIGIQVAGFAVGGLATLLGGLISVLGMTFGPIGLIAAAIAAAAYKFLQWTAVGQQMKDRAMAIFKGIADHARLMFGGIQDALAAGEWKLAAKIGWAGIKQPFVSGWNFIREGFVSIKLLVSQTWADMWNGIASTATKVWGWLKKRWIEVKNFFGAGIDTEVAFKQIDELTEGRLDARGQSAADASSRRANAARDQFLDIQKEERENRAELQKLRQEAATKRAEREAEIEDEPPPAADLEPPPAPELPPAPKGFGSFSSAAIGRMGQQVEKRMEAEKLAALREIAENTAGVAGAAWI